MPVAGGIECGFQLRAYAARICKRFIRWCAALIGIVAALLLPATNAATRSLPRISSYRRAVGGALAVYHTLSLGASVLHPPALECKSCTIVLVCIDALIIMSECEVC